MATIQDKGVLVAGGAGFMGSALIRELLTCGATVVSYDSYIHGTSKNFEDLQAFVETKHLTICFGDVLLRQVPIEDAKLSGVSREWISLEKALRDNHVEYIINCIGDPFIPATDKDPDRCRLINAEGTRYVLETARKCSVKRVLHISSCEVYGVSNISRLTENVAFNPHSVYAKSKCTAEEYCDQFASDFFAGNSQTSVVIGRLFNCYGPRSSHPYIIPEMIRQLSQCNVLRLGNITARDFTYVHDAARAVLEILTANLSNSVTSSLQAESFNIGSGRAYSIDDLAKKLATIMKSGELEIVRDATRQREHDIPSFVCDNTKLCNATNWAPTVDMEEGLRKTVAWFQDHQARWEFSLND